MRKFNFSIFAIQKTLKYPFNLTGPFEKIVRQFKNILTKVNMQDTSMQN